MCIKNLNNNHFYFWGLNSSNAINSKYTLNHDIVECSNITCSLLVAN